MYQSLTGPTHNLLLRWTRRPPFPLSPFSQLTSQNSSTPILTTSLRHHSHHPAALPSAQTGLKSSGALWSSVCTICPAS
ncbi:hypothetical protein PCANC_20658 [Puccinia coronata f. sp. avenae]|uniref:Uncharacterized protein n=1 Tax=Puccinia coronata f. sp. avenae TaxID=200324 RepID=A0A2N5UQ06_9BASI|nr:hypothetical protein PCANC_20658 [Puccinia coronata f. sp. avenae]